MTIEHIFFDIGGVLGSNGWDREQRARAIERFHLDPEDFQARHEEVVGEWEEGRISLDEYLDFAIFYTRRGFTKQEFGDFVRAQSIPDQETIAIARSLTSHKRFTLMTLNNESEDLNRYRIRAFGISEIFEAFLSSCWLGVRKPTQRFYQHALGIAQADPARSLFIDDRAQNLRPASALGMNVLQFKSATQLSSDLEKFLDLKFSGA